MGDYALQPGVLSALLAYVGILAQMYDERLYDDRNLATVRLARDIREMCVAEYGCFPPPLE
jgi:hypothetical protein